MESPTTTVPKVNHTTPYLVSSPTGRWGIFNTTTFNGSSGICTPSAMVSGYMGCAPEQVLVNTASSISSYTWTIPWIFGISYGFQFYKEMTL
jgi:hypothetical protein